MTIAQIEKAIDHPVAITLPTDTASLIRAVDTGEPISPEQKSEFGNQIKNWAAELAPARIATSGNETQICVLDLARSCNLRTALPRVA